MKWKSNRLKWYLILLSLIILVIYLSKKYGITEKAECPVNASISIPREDNRRVVSNYPLGNSGSYLPALGLAKFKDVSDIHKEPVVITTGSSFYVSRIQGWLKHLIKDMKPKLKIVIYDIGFTAQQREQICQHGQCEVKEFPFRQFPVFVEDCIPCTSWKPLAIQLALEEFGFVIWMDAAVFLMDGNLQAGIDSAKETGFAIGHETYGVSTVDIASETAPETFRALGEDPCAFKNCTTISASLLFIQKSRYTYKYIMRPWVSCALTKSCIAGGRALQNKCKFSKNYRHCHRFAQSVLGIILNRLYYSYLDTVDLGNNVKWRKCFIGQDHILIDDIVYLQHEKKDIIQCPDGKLEL
ncbi:uncharacterized protein LOC123536928 [Mercenaria mercenaria]|uniref:uncharacterized protein LOC123536928 n=1 Tax=Mercenaria mercenaria TaxID=6596 RepID=UPI001E1DC998|nr:uncharacterized protein LOC123536928 [Mercenaria mercenaria]